MDIRKLVCIQKEINREKELYKRPNCVLQALPLIVRRKLTFTLTF